MSAATAAEPDGRLDELALCSVAPEHFIDTWCKIKDDAKWLPFGLWPSQREVLRGWLDGHRHLVLKARQVGLSWLSLALALWLLVFRPGSTVLLLSLRETEAIELLERLSGMLERLPEWMRPTLETDSATLIKTASGSSARALPSHRGDSYTASLVVVDEAALIPDLGRLLGSLAPTVADGGRILLVSRANKRDPSGTFARLCRLALEGDGPWSFSFLPWSARPGRTPEWYAEQVSASLAASGGLDDVQEQYPSTPEEALAPASLHKRLPAAHLLPVYRRSDPLPSLPSGAPAIEGLRVYALPVPGRRYVAGCDVAEGLPGPDHDDSALTVLDAATGDHVAQLTTRLEPSEDWPAAVYRVCAWYGAAVLVERNNHGHATLGTLARLGAEVLDGPDGRPGYAKSPASKAQLWAQVWGEIVERSRQTTAALAAALPLPPPLVRDTACYHQLASLEARTCKAPSGEHDDDADAWGLAQAARAIEPPGDLYIGVM